jgi:NAD(P)-dependent dehydrogenase (short-subunit alcohol dehydrogenase family)
MPGKKPLSEQVVVVAGGSYGLGRAIAERAARGGARVAIGARTREALDSVGVELALETDVAERSQVERLLAATVERFGRIDTYVANAMVTVYAEAHRLEDDELRRVFDVNFFGSVYGYWAALPHLRESRGTFVQIASALSYRGIPLQAAYCSTKAALRTFLESARVELEREGSGVDVSVILPGAINTPQFDRARQKMGLQPQPVPPIYQPEVAAEAVLLSVRTGRRELYVGWPTVKAIVGNKIAPSFGDLYLARTAYDAQQTEDPVQPDRPDNLFDPVPGDFAAHGPFDDRAKPRSLQLQASLNRRWLGAGAAGMAALVSVLRRDT